MRGQAWQSKAKRLPLNPNTWEPGLACGETARLARADRHLSKFRACISILGAVTLFVEVMLFSYSPACHRPRHLRCCSPSEARLLGMRDDEHTQ